MTSTVNLSDERPSTAASPSKLSIAMLLVVVLLLSLAAGYYLRDAQIPAENSVEVGFARDMSIHHEQAVEMATLLYERTDDPQMKTLAYDIMLTQQGQIGIMSGWLDAWDHAWTSVGPRMEWMGMSVTGLMPGMATAEQINTLRSASGLEADAIFLQLMIPHHQSGVSMAQAAADNTDIAPVRQLAQGMADAQVKEIDLMQQMLVDRGFERVPDELPSMEMDMEMDGMSGDE